MLAAAALVGFPPGVQAVSIQATGLAGPLPVGPSFARVANPQIVPVLGLQAKTSYQFVAVGQLSDGGTLTSNQAYLETGTLPAGLPTFVPIDEDALGQGPYTLMANVPAYPGIPGQYLTIIDSQAQPAWYVRLPDRAGNVGDFEQQPDGSYTVASYASTVFVAGSDQVPAVFLQYDGLGNLLRTWTSPSTVGSTAVLANSDHEFRLLSDGTALLFGITLEQEDLRATFDGGQPDAGVYGSLLEHLAPDGGVLFSWSSFAIPITDLDPGIIAGGGGAAAVIDAYHGNSIDVMSDGDYLVSLRNTSEVVKVDSITGAIVWILGGPRSTFVFLDDPEGGFSLQHGARELPNGHLILFDDGNFHSPADSRAVEYELDLAAGVATEVWESRANPPLAAYALGYAQRLVNGNTLVAYGTTRYVQEVAPDAGVVWELYDPADDLGVYRAYRLDSLY